MKESVSFDHINQITLGDPAATRNLLEVFIRQNKLNIAQMQEHLVMQNWSDLKRVAHKLKSSLALLGMRGNRAQADELEETAGSDLARTHALVAELARATYFAIDEINLKLKSL